jgi:hypothetical protein
MDKQAKPTMQVGVWYFGTPGDGSAQQSLVAENTIHYAGPIHNEVFRCQSSCPMFHISIPGWGRAGVSSDIAAQGVPPARATITDPSAGITQVQMASTGNSKASWEQLASSSTYVLQAELSPRLIPSRSCEAQQFLLEDVSTTDLVLRVSTPQLAPALKIGASLSGKGRLGEPHLL